MRTLDLGKRMLRGFNLVPALLTAVLFVFGAVAALDFSHSWTGAERGMLIFEKACPLSAAPQNKT